MWGYIHNKYAYTVEFDSEQLIEKAIATIDEKMYVTSLTYVRTIGEQGNGTLDFTEGKTRTSTLKSAGGSNVKYDLIGKICAGASLTRKTVARILQGIKPETFAKFKINPEEFISNAIKYINEQKASMIVDEIEYNISDEKPYDSNIFATGGVVNFERAVKADKHITPYVVVDSDIEKNFAKEIDSDEDKVCVYAKLPKSFKIPTPVGDYSPDWAIAFYEGTVKYIYFVAETKGSEEHRDAIEIAKNKCAEKLFKKLNNGTVHYGVVNSYKNLLDVMNK